MGKTAELKKLIKAQLQTIPGETYHKSAPEDAVYPYKCFTLKNVTFTDSRDDFDLTVDVWCRGANKLVADDTADQVEKLFRNVNLPQKTILPTFYRDSRTNVDDPDKSLQHIQLHFYVQLYEMEE